MGSRRRGGSSIQSSQPSGSFGGGAGVGQGAGAGADALLLFILSRNRHCINRAAARAPASLAAALIRLSPLCSVTLARFVRMNSLRLARPRTCGRRREGGEEERRGGEARRRGEEERRGGEVQGQAGSGVVVGALVGVLVGALVARSLTFEAPRPPPSASARMSTL